MTLKGNVLLWIEESFLAGRRQCSFEKWTFISGELLKRVPHGSVFGSVLFLLFINDLPNSVKATAKIVADDTKSYYKISKVADCGNLQVYLNKLEIWFKKYY